MSQIRQSFELGIKRLQAKHDSEEKTKVGSLRAGNAGFVTVDGKFVGQCARLTYLRHLGIKIEDNEESKEHMFAAGRGNEDLWMQVLREGWPGKIRTESDIPTKWVTDNGINVTGRPDIVLCSSDDKPEYGIELKLVSSVWTAKDVLFGGHPKLDHITQAAHYAWQLNVPFEIWYTSRVNWPVVGWMGKMFPKAGEPGSEHCVYGDSGIKRINPFVVGYELKITNQGVMFRLAGSKDQWQVSPVTINGIKEYYNVISKMTESDTLPPLSLNLDANGDKLNWSKAEYCALGDLCCGDKSRETSVKNWLVKVKERLQID